MHIIWEKTVFGSYSGVETVATHEEQTVSKPSLRSPSCTERAEVSTASVKTRSVVRISEN